MLIYTLATKWYYHLLAVDFCLGKFLWDTVKAVCCDHRAVVIIARTNTPGIKYTIFNSLGPLCDATRPKVETDPCIGTTVCFVFFSSGSGSGFHTTLAMLKMHFGYNSVY